MTDWSEIVARHGGIVWRTVRRIVEDEHDASDCFQEVFVDALQFAKKQSVVNWPGLLKRLATARALDLLRTRMRLNKRNAKQHPDVESPSLTTAAEKLFEQNELIGELRTALATMPDEQAEVCCLRYLESMTYEQIADQTGIAVNHIGVLLHRAKNSLRIQLASFAPNARELTEKPS